MKTEKNYWNENGLLQKEYDTLHNNGFVFTKKEKNEMHKYYRYYNDGDRPMGACYYSNAMVEDYLEREANIAVAKAYKRYCEQNNITMPLIVKYYARKELMGFKTYVEKVGRIF